MDLFDLDELPTYLQVSDVDTATAELARRIASGWIRSNAGHPFDDSVPEEIHGWALELAALLYANPQSMQSETAGPYSYQQRARRDQILAEVRQWRADQAAAGKRGQPRTILVEPALRMRHPSRWRGHGGW